jgi:transcription elongation factor GreA-like protein
MTTHDLEKEKYHWEKFLDEVLPDWDKILTMRIAGAGRKTTEGYFKLRQYLREEINKNYVPKEEVEEIIPIIKEIIEGKGAFSREPIIHAENTINAMKELAKDILDKLNHLK